MKKTIIIGLMILMFLPICFASEFPDPFTLNQNIDLKIPCFDTNNNFCDNSTNCTLTANNPHGAVVVSNGNMTRNPSYYNYTINASNINLLGEYFGWVQCVGSSGSDYDTFSFQVTTAGNRDPLDTSSSMAITLFLLFLSGGFFYVYLGVPRFVQDDLLEYTIRQGTLIGGVLSLTLMIDVMIIISTNASLNINTSLFLIMRIIGWILQAIIYITFFIYMMKAIQMLKEKRERDRFGEQ